MSNQIELEGRIFVPASELDIPDWGCVVSDRNQPTLTLKDDDLFLITDTLGNISGCSRDETISSLGLFCRDTRFLSRLELQIAGRSPILLTCNADKGFALSALCTNPTIPNINAETISIQREIVLNGSLFEELTIHNYNTTPVSFELSLSFDADFSDLFEIRGFGRKQRGGLLRRVQPDKQVPATVSELTMAYLGLDGAILESHIQFAHRLPDYLKGYTAIWQIELESHASCQIGYRLEMLMNNRPVSRVNSPMALFQAKAAEMMEEDHWRSQITQIRTDNPKLNQAIERAEQDVYLLRQSFDLASTNPSQPSSKGTVLSAGVPWFCTLFGRDAIIAASQVLILDPTIARETLMVLAQYQGKVDDEWREEQPGKILHELRMGEMARCQEIPHTPYYGTVDATPLWLMLYAEYYAWTHDTATLDRLWSNAVAAMAWVDRMCAETGYLRYFRTSARGLVNQGWKDSGDCIVDRQGKIATGPITLCEVQAYVYAAKIRMSELARIRQENDLASRWQQEAQQLKQRFNHDFWIPDRDFIALALDGAGKQVDSISSNPGQCLQQGLLYPEKAKSVAERLRAPDMFSGWGIRTLSSQSPAYNPIGYHTGSVWPHDNSLITMGLRSVGAVEQALEVAQGILDMTVHQPYHRPPELFCGYERTEGQSPIQYPVACSPQAWATGTIFQLLQMMVNLVPDAPSNYLRILDPALPSNIHQISFKNLRVGATSLDLEFNQRDAEGEGLRATTSCRVLKKRGNLRVTIEA
ncbi:amylo-alpha-1,6-glucosidase [Chamaesiphon minutus]|uniref:Glycogen debranching enzyme n=1 Tax=Chamaesiphon minutus (strain ATCC 27169 / PCC 6605) TaxID=1173020 RepID=K9UM82_CHAP6|nr:amylo-alpha-1,6-glucosidase [Chamaesiphon minutus]AFY95930.1 glycogen debranching enzyme [Chamaesiphon minutus PCC 6605]